MSNIKINNMNLRDHKSFKLIYKFNILKDCLKNNNFILFFYYDFLNSQTRMQLKKQLKNNDLKLIILKKNSLFNYLSNSKFKFINNLLKDNIIIIYNKNNEIIDQITIKKLLTVNNIKLVGCL
jgi:ribosomal protein L10